MIMLSDSGVKHTFVITFTNNNYKDLLKKGKKS